MGALDEVVAQLKDLRTEAADRAAEVAEDLTDLETQIAELRDLVEQLEANQADPAQLDEVKALVAEIDATVAGIRDIPDADENPDGGPTDNPEAPAPITTADNLPQQ